MNNGSIAREYVYIIGEVLQQSRYTLPFEHKAVLADALLESSGGVSSLTGNPKQIYVLRGGGRPKKLCTDYGTAPRCEKCGQLPSCDTPGTKAQGRCLRGNAAHHKLESHD